MQGVGERVDRRVVEHLREAREPGRERAQGLLEVADEAVHPQDQALHVLQGVGGRHDGVGHLAHRLVHPEQAERHLGDGVASGPEARDEPGQHWYPRHTRSVIHR